MSDIKMCICAAYTGKTFRTSRLLWNKEGMNLNLEFI